MIFVTHLIFENLLTKNRHLKKKKFKKITLTGNHLIQS